MPDVNHQPNGSGECGRIGYLQGVCAHTNPYWDCVYISPHIHIDLPQKQFVGTVVQYDAKSSFAILVRDGCAETILRLVIGF